METTAVYLEPRIRTYAFQLEMDLSLFEVKIDVAEAGDRGGVIEALEDTAFPFRLVLGRIQDNRFLTLSLVVAQVFQEQIMDLLAFTQGIGAGDASLTFSPVELLFFQGPHYGDRPGIAYAALESLRSRDIEVVAMGFSVSCVYLVFEKGLGKRARDILMESFEIPARRSYRGTTGNNDV